jgi:hypothetical protein
MEKKYCYKDGSRICDDSCTAYCIDPRHGVHCLDLASQLESLERAKHMSLSNELYAVNAKLLASSLNSFRDTFKAALG